MRDDDPRTDDLRAAAQFFAAQLRGEEAKKATDAEATDAEATDAEATDAETTDAANTKLLRWTRHKLRSDVRAVAGLMLKVGYRPTYIRYFLRYHVPALRESAAIGETYIDPGAAPEARLGLCWRLDEDVLTVYSDLHIAAKRLRQPYRDLAAVCLRWGYVHETVVQLLAKTLERKPRNVVED